MFRKPRFVFFAFLASLILAADPPWASKRAAEWTASDALQVLSDSPWAKRAVPAVLPALTAFERRDGGNIGAQGGGQGMRLDRIPEALNPLGTTRPSIRPDEARAATLGIRWESALPIRAAEFKANETGVPDVDGEDYAVAVYDVSFKLASIDKMQKKDLGKELRKIAMLKFEGRPDSMKEIRPHRVTVIELGSDTATVVYMFPRSAHITASDKRLEFDAQIGRIAVAQYFYPPEMQFQGKLEL